MPSGTSSGPPPPSCWAWCSMVPLLSMSFVAAFGGFVVMLVSALWFERNARRLGRAGWDQMTKNMRTPGFRDFLGNQSSRMRDRFKRDE
ncbi:MAG: hypothetical protein U5R31_14015 [Acidimicrobiia bacterium]|nr:hypothetical protein [Acidimicrobiia bacterium]